MTVPVEPPTAASASFPTKFPTTIASTVLYSCWKREPHKIGKKNRRINSVILPSNMFKLFFTKPHLH